MYSMQAKIWKQTAMVLCDKHNRVLLDTLRKTTKYLKLIYHPGMVQEGLLTTWVSCYVLFWATLK